MPDIESTAFEAIADLRRMDADGWTYTLTVGPAEAFAVVALLQLALKQRDTGPGWVSDKVGEIARSIERAVGQTGAIQEILREGWQPR